MQTECYDVAPDTAPDSVADTAPSNRLALQPSPALPFLLASVLTAYPDEAFAGNLRLLFEDEGLEAEALRAGRPSWEALLNTLDQVFASAESLDDLRSDYIDLFDRGASASPLYETEYGRDRAMRKASELADLAGFYTAFGFKTDPNRLHDMLDHLSVELEFYALMRLKEEALQNQGNAEGVEIVRDARQKFLREHLGRLPGAVANRPVVEGHASYGPILRWCAALLAAECQAEAVVPLPLEWISGQAEGDAVECGAACAMPNGPKPPTAPVIPV